MSGLTDIVLYFDSASAPQAEEKVPGQRGSGRDGEEV